MKNFRTWEYKIVVMKTNDVQAIADTLNRLGDDRWDCFWVDNSETEKTFYFKKAPITVTEYIYGIKP
jgi:hypothetical protein